MEIGPPCQASLDQSEVAALSLEVATMKAVLEDLKGREIYIVHSRKHHRIGVPEASNNPSRWATVCGWRYGLGHFFRAAWMAEADIKCRRCFPECFDRAEGSDSNSLASDDSRSGPASSSDSSSDSS